MYTARHGRRASLVRCARVSLSIRIVARKWEGEEQMLTIELDGMDACACEDAYERVAHLFSIKNKRSQREYTRKSDTGQCSRRRLNKQYTPRETRR
jgi:hypothetical protein